MSSSNSLFVARESEREKLLSAEIGVSESHRIYFPLMNPGHGIESKTECLPDAQMSHAARDAVQVSTGLVHIGLEDGLHLSEKVAKSIEDPEKVAEQVRNLHYSFERPIRQMLGPPPFTSELAREIRTYQSFVKTGELPTRQRVSLGISSFLESGTAIGYQAMTILREASPTKYEKEYLGIIEPITCAHLKLTMLDKDYWGSGLASRLLGQRLDLGRQFVSHALVDTKEANTRMHRFLRREGFRKQRYWQTPAGNTMYRFKKKL